MLAGAKGKSLRDKAAHERPLQLAYLVVRFDEGRIGIELHDADAGQLAPIRVEDMNDRNLLDHEPRLTKALDAQLADLVDFCVELLELAARAEAHRVANA